MRTCNASCGFAGLESLEARRMLSAAVYGAPPDAGAGSSAAGHLTAAFAQGRGMRGSEIVWGEQAIVDGQRVATWGIVSKKTGLVMAAGVTLPLALAESQPPRGLIASLDFPEIVRESTYFNHMGLNSTPEGHAFAPFASNPDRYRTPHFDIHFYSISEAEVQAIPAGPPLVQVPPDRLPAGYAQPGFSEPQMGRHAVPLSEFSEPDIFSEVMVAGFTPDVSRMHFIEPMVTCAKLLEAEDFSLPIPMPQKFDFDSLYPSRLDAVLQGGAYHFIFSDFFDTDPSTPVAGAAPNAEVPAAAPRGSSQRLVRVDSGTPHAPRVWETESDLDDVTAEDGVASA